MKTDKDVSIDLADHYRNVSKLNFEHKLGLIIQNAMQKQNHPGILMNTFSETELYQAVSNVKPGKASWKGLLDGHFLKHISPIAKERLLKLMNDTWIAGQIPTPWKHAICFHILRVKEFKTNINEKSIM